MLTAKCLYLRYNIVNMYDLVTEFEFNKARQGMGSVKLKDLKPPERFKWEMDDCPHCREFFSVRKDGRDRICERCHKIWSVD